MELVKKPNADLYREGQYLEIGGKLRDIWFSSDLLDL
jgi:hypothetical protein